MDASSPGIAMIDAHHGRQSVGLPIANGRPAPDHPGTLHVRCGSDIHGALKHAGFCGRFLEFSDPYCQGPVRRLDRDAFIEERAAFVDAAYGEHGASHRERLRAQYDDLDRAGRFERIVLWFEHDAFDQLILAYVLSRLPRVAAAVPIELICVDHVPGVERFIGLGQLSPAELIDLWNGHRRDVTTADHDAARLAWDALRDDNPARLAELAGDGNRAMRIMARALRRHLQELPDARDGLGLTQRLVLEIVEGEGPIPAGQVFRRLMMEREPLPFLGDLMFWHVVQDLATTREPVIAFDTDSRDQSWPRKKLSIESAGRCILRGDTDYLDLYDGRRWVGGIEVNRNGTTPRWDRESDRLAPTPG